MRRRLGSGKEEELPWEGTLKSRSGDRYHTSYRRKHMNECHTDFTQGHSKLEEDIPHFDWTGNMFSFSQKCDIPAVKHPLRSLQHVVDVWYEMEKNILDLEWDLEAELHLVSNLTMIEVVYEDFWIDFDTGDDDELAEVKVTLWYHDSEELYNNNNRKNQSTSGDEDDSRLVLMESLKQQPPVLAEMSYTIQSNKEKWSETTIMRAHSLWDQCSNLDRWLDPKSSTKTAWVYRYDAEFCDAKNVEGESA
jgi:hypothetical protein